METGQSATKIKNWGTLYCIGTGPGDPELITLKALRILQTAPVILVPRNASSGHTQAFDIIQQYVDASRQQIVPLDFPMTRERVKLEAAWDAASEVIAKVLAEGSDAVFPVLGDPLLYGTFNYILERASRYFPQARIEVVPGVTSIQAATAASLVPLSEAGERIAILPAIYEASFEQLCQTFNEYDTVVLMKVGSALERLIPLLQSQDRLKSAVLVERLGLEGERIVKGEAIAGLQARQLHYFSLLIIKK